MIAAQISAQDVKDGFGLPAAIVIVSMAIVIIFLVRHIIKMYTDRDLIQEQRIREAKEVRDIYAEPLQKQVQLTQQIYEAVIRNSQGK